MYRRTDNTMTKIRKNESTDNDLQIIYRKLKIEQQLG